MGPRNRHSALPRGIHFAQNREGLSCKREIVSDRCAAFFHRLGPALRERPRWLASRSSRRRSRRRPRDFFPFHRALRSAQAGHRSANDPALRHGLTRILETKIPPSDTNPAPAVFQTSHQPPPYFGGWLVNCSSSSGLSKFSSAFPPSPKTYS